jgi:hypothetical protein
MFSDKFNVFSPWYVTGIQVTANLSQSQRFIKLRHSFLSCINTLFDINIYVVAKLPMVSTGYECHVTYYKFVAKFKTLTVISI